MSHSNSFYCVSLYNFKIVEWDSIYTHIQEEIIYTFLSRKILTKSLMASFWYRISSRNEHTLFDTDLDITLVIQAVYLSKRDERPTTVFYRTTDGLNERQKRRKFRSLKLEENRRKPSKTRGTTGNFDQLEKIAAYRYHSFLTFVPLALMLFVLLWAHVSNTSNRRFVFRNQVSASFAWVTATAYESAALRCVHRQHARRRPLMMSRSPFRRSAVPLVSTHRHGGASRASFEYFEWRFTFYLTFSSRI